ncbi:MAG: 2,5-diamino-6-(ribosylamino)-4(3H)-pyrimidinone 5'-phosphate reductase [Methanothrix sp.]|nr:2,5-diamino-6-(ribosylamino)-4(3H)-pyrimidinone 5'-phosphate reductase [Methanothrix sp.]
MPTRPHVFINCAMSADGKISTVDRRQLRISGDDDRERVDRLRAESDAIMVGVGTVLADDPGLRVRSEILRRQRSEMGKPESPLRVVADSLARTPPWAKVLGDGCLIAISQEAPQERLGMLPPGCEILRCGRKRVDLTDLLSALHERGIRRLMVEGGGSLNWSLFRAGLVDEIYTFVGGLILGGSSAPSPVDGEGFREGFPRLRLVSAERMDDGVLLRWRVHH